MSATLPASLPSTGTWTVDPIHSTARFSIVHHAIATFRAGFTEISGAYDATAGTLTGSVQVQNIDLQGPARFTDHLLSDHFFDAAQFPTLSFASTALSADAAGSVQLNGELTLKGVTRPISASGLVRGPITVHHNDGHESERLAIDLTTVIDRRDYGITHNNELAQGVLNLGWNVTIEVALELVEQ
jgi:polyisoprenoid-binding protein YceI